MNKYLEKIAQLVSDDTKQATKTFAAATLAGLPAKVVGGAVGGYLGNRFIKNFHVPVPKFINQAGKVHISGDALGSLAGAEIGSGAAEIAAIKHSLKKEQA